MDERRPPTADFKFKFRCLPDEELNEQRERPPLPSLPLSSPFFLFAAINHLFYCCFSTFPPHFSLFLSLYSTSYPEAISLLTKLLQAKHTNSLLASTQKLLQHRLPLGSYLLKPVQRILKYHLLLDVSYPVE